MRTIDFRLDDRKLEQLYAAMEPKRRKQALSGTYRRCASYVRSAALSYLRSSVRSNRALEKGVRTVIYSGNGGFKVTVGSKRATFKSKLELGMYTNRWGQKRPVLVFLEDGSHGERETSTYKMWGKRYKSMRMRKGHPTGKLSAYRFMYRAKLQTKSYVINSFHQEFRTSVEATAKKYGCAV